ncbi:MAG: class D beta-lactamase [Chitinophagaceae bacterium]|nr:MAG: class D beta-lactamase [Chitinophagaceae bacterium]
MRTILATLAAALLLAGCSTNNVTTDDSLGKFFSDNGTEGCFAVLNNATGAFTMYNLPRFRDSAFTPASTFKIVNSLVGLQTGIISNDSMVIRWNGVPSGRTECDADMSMYTAFRRSCPAWYQEAARRIGRDTMQRWLDSLAYGNKKISKVDTFWLDNSLKIRPDEELGLVKRLYFNQLPFFKTNQEIVKRAMLFESTPAYRLAYKTGWGKKENGRDLAWVVGWVEENNHPYFFALNFETLKPGVDVPTVRMNMLKGILKKLGYLEGRK